MINKQLFNSCILHQINERVMIKSLYWARILGPYYTSYNVAYRLIGRNGHFDQSEAYDISQRVREYGPWDVPVYMMHKSSGMSYFSNIYFIFMVVLYFKQSRVHHHLMIHVPGPPYVTHHLRNQGLHIRCSGDLSGITGVEQ